MEAQALDLTNLYAEYLTVEELNEGDLVVEKPGLTQYTRESGLIGSTVFMIWKLLPPDANLTCFEKAMIESHGRQVVNGMHQDCILGYIDDDGLRYCLHSTVALKPYVPAVAD